MSDEGRPEPAAAPGRIALRSPLEAFLWIFITRLIALVTAGRASSAIAEPTGDATAIGPERDDPGRARRVAASRPSGPTPTAPEPSDPAAPRDERTRTVAITAATAVVGAAAAFAVGRRRGAR